ncbi:SH3 domain-containing protein [Bradyrhizobium sp. LTSPM299]|uniref:SH3 domain-containing protein n=1 Tax=Bradyrhizobium sp. LTSPM299 TaxID=1619233 RepID=UPI000A4A1E1C|nr:SH3 domain-containing protein [Bradyrhizobium sp. LTSPM299]
MKSAPLAVSTLLALLAVQPAEAQTAASPPEATVPPAATPPAAEPPPAAPPPVTATPAAAAVPPAPAATSPATPPTTTPSASSGRPSTVYTTVNLREGPGTTYGVITKIPAGSRINVGNCSGQFCQASWQGKDGYVIATSLARRRPNYGPPGPPPGYVEPPVYAGPPIYYRPRPYTYGYYGPGPYWGYRRWRYW